MTIFQFGRFLGYTTVFFYVLTLMNYVVKYVNKNHFKVNKTVMKYMVRYHHIWGFLAVAALIGHMSIQFNYFGFNPTGFTAAVLLLFQAGLGAFGKKNRKVKWWLPLHRFVAVAMVVAILVHVLL